MKNLKRNKGLKAVIFLLVFAAVIAITMLLWNALLPAIFGITTINYWQAAGLLILSRLLLGGFGKFGPNGHFRHHRSKSRERSREEMFELHDKLKGMSFDERAEFIRRRMACREDEKQ